ncbi:DUF2163 domain-containing protein [Shimia abyssi]|uniref:Putative phage protein (TIGR02218 family) n=1 Tax=Shimia abyssi TaxID=1662395 RepID=A0A2P8FFU6_9RHOB|nr:DUF2163 domain-containing protein [Shimia abyssi]PSL20582.1 putative phage protein (TIGR02218 family) [Shimia abyssi]
MSTQQELYDHLETGLTTIARAWGIVRSDGARFGFTDHDCDLSFEDFQFKASSGVTASLLEQSSGLSVDNSEALGVLSDFGVKEADILAGRFDDAQVTAWMVNWANPDARTVIFRGSIGEIGRSNGAFRAELRGLSEAMNRPLGRVFQKPCTAVLGDTTCRFDTATGGYSHLAAIEETDQKRVFSWNNLSDFEPGWFIGGVLQVKSGAANGLSGNVKRDYVGANGLRVVELWEPIRVPISVGDQVRLVAGCDKRFQTCRLKFNNALNFQGFPDIPGEDWMTSFPSQGGENSGGSLR